MAHPSERKLVLRFCLTTIGVLACLFAWLCVLSFSSADPPADNVWPQNSPPANLCGGVGAWLAFYLFYYLGVGAYALLTLVTLIVLTWSKAGRFTDPWLRTIGVLLVCAVISTWGAQAVAASDKYPLMGPGGVVGAAAWHVLRIYFQTAGSYIILASSLVVGLILAADDLVALMLRGVGWTSRRTIPVLTRSGNAVADAGAAVVGGVATSVAAVSERLGSNGQRRPAPRLPAVPLEDVDEPAEDDHPASVPLVASGRLRFETLEQEDAPAPPAVARPVTARAPAPAPAAPPPALPAAPPAAQQSQPATEPVQPSLFDQPRATTAEAPTARIELKPSTPKESPRSVPRPTPSDDDYKLPPISLLEDAVPIDKASIEILCREKAYILEQTLNEFRVSVQVVAIETGPVITVFELKLAPGIKVSQIASLSNDMARALKAPAVRVVAPLPGKNTIGIEVPNIDKEKVRLRDIIETFGRRAEGHQLPLYLGKDASGQPLVSDLTRMPHLLIAGTTGSGKSICVSSLISSLLLTRTPSEVNLILVDPKMVELAAYKDIPHLMCPIITDTTKAETILEWAATLMDERYALLAEAGVRDIRGYNRLGRKGLQERLDIASDEEMDRIPIHLPYIIIIIDELADLMMTSAKEVEFNLCRLAQKSRAVGIHLIVSTQRPQANVVTGLIKSNLPCRICFRVSSRLDSRIVLDQNGGETLMGQGDMLFLAPGTSKLMRAQGTFMSDDELRNVVKHCKEQRPPNFHPELVRMPGSAAGSSTERDELFDPAVEIILESGRGSVSLLQRRLTIGYGRASRLIDQMYEAGIVGEYKGSQAREVIVTQDEWQAIKAQRNREEAAEAESASASGVEFDADSESEPQPME